MTPDSKENSPEPLHIEVRVTEVYATFREKLIGDTNEAKEGIVQLFILSGL
jgi:hypothetical protein